MIEFSIPDVFTCLELDLFLLDYIKRNPEKFYDDFFIGSVYGSFPCVWNGGRTLIGDFGLSDVEHAVLELNKRNVPVRWTFTNNLLEPKHRDDRIGNRILEITRDVALIDNNVNVGSQAMIDYIEKHYPELKIVLSTTLCISDPDKINELSEKYLMVPDYNINNKWDELAKLKHPENIEMLLNDSCRDNCPLRKKHYEANSRFNLREDGEPTSCAYTSDGSSYSLLNQKLFHHISRKDIVDKYLPLGINKFKLVGRGVSHSALLEGICEYMVKPEYHDEIKSELAKILSKTSQGAKY